MELPSRHLRPLSEPLPRWLGALTILLVIRVLVSSAMSGALNPQSGMTGVDFRVYYDAARRLNEGQRLYRPDPSQPDNAFAYVYTPLLAQLLRPAAIFPWEKALKIWFVISAGALLLAVGLYARAAAIRDPLAIVLLLVTAFRFWPATTNFALGNENTLLLACLCGIYLAIRHEALKTAAVLIVIAALFKTWMLGLILYFIIRRAWSALGVTTAVFAAGLILLFLPLANGEFRDFVHINRVFMVQPAVVSHSIAGFAALHFQENPLHVHALVNQRWVHAAWTFSGWGMVIAGLAWLMRCGKTLQPKEETVRLGLVVLSILLLSTVFHAEYLLLCLPLLWTLLIPGAAIRLSWTSGAAIVVYLLLTVGWPSTSPVPPAYWSGAKSLLVSAHCFIALALWGIGLWTLGGLNRELAANSRAGNGKIRRWDKAQRKSDVPEWRSHVRRSSRFGF